MYNVLFIYINSTPIFCSLFYSPLIYLIIIINNTIGIIISIINVIVPSATPPAGH